MMFPRQSCLVPVVGEPVSDRSSFKGIFERSVESSDVSWGQSGPAHQDTVPVLYGVKLHSLQVIVYLNLNPLHL